jgi:hypothetical protein
MATTTPNFGWPVPTSTDLVKDGATAIEALGDSIDASLLDLKGGTTGQVLSKNSNTDMDFIWVTDAAGDITGVTATSPLTGGGTSGTVTVGIQDATTSVKGAVQLTDSISSTSTTTAATPNSVKTSYDLANAAIAKSTITTKGDLIVGTGSGTFIRQGVGANGTVLTADSAEADGVKWAAAAGGGALTLISSTSFSGSSAHNVNDVFSTTYQNYLVQITLTGASATGYQQMRFRVSGADNSTSNYFWSGMYNSSGSTGYSGEGAGSVTSVSYGYTETTATGIFSMTIANPFETLPSLYTATHTRTSGSNSLLYYNTGAFGATTSFTGFTLFPASGNITGKVRVYGYSN